MYRNDLTLSVINFKVHSDKKDNLESMIEKTLEAAAEGSDLILFPEMCLTGYELFVNENVSREEKLNLSETICGPSVTIMERLAIEQSKYIVFGMPERDLYDPDKLYNTAIILGPEGYVGSYRKIHPWGRENTWCQKGSSPYIFNTPWGPFSIGICYDNYQFPELVRYYVWKGSRLHLNPTAVSEEVDKTGSRHAWRRGYEPHLQYISLSSSIYVASSNLTGWDGDLFFGGGSCVIGPCDTPFQEVECKTYLGNLDSTSDQVFTGTIDLSKAIRHQCIDNPYGGGPDYRPDIYKKLFDEIG